MYMYILNNYMYRAPQCTGERKRNEKKERRRMSTHIQVHVDIHVHVHVPILTLDKRAVGMGEKNDNNYMYACNNGNMMQ